jgi:hypothetical protein
MVIMLIAAFGAWFLPEFRVVESGRYSSALVVVLIAGPVFLVILLSWIALGYPVVISQTELTNRSALPFRKPLKLSRLYVAGSGRRKLFGMPFAVELVSSATAEKGRPHFVSTMLLGIGVHTLSALLTYRIAKAKGEIPPPPAFL